MISQFRDWFKVMQKNELIGAQRDLISHTVPCLDQVDATGRVARLGKAYIDDTNYLNEFSITNYGEASGNGSLDKVDNLLMIHGYGAGLGLFCRNYNELTALDSSANKKIQLFSIDLLGHSLSSSPKFEFDDAKFKTPRIKINFKKEDQRSVNERPDAPVQDESKILEDNTKVTVKDEKNVSSLDYQDSQDKLLELSEITARAVRNYEDYYVGSIEKWRQQRRLDKINLLGHSFGAYLSLCYTMKYPQNVESLILVSPVGVERSIFAINAMKQHAGDVLNSGLHHIVPSADRFSYDHTGRLVQVPGFFQRLWDTTYFPFSILRGAGPLGVYLASSYTTRRYNQGSTSDEERALLAKYVLATFWKKSSTEKAISRILSPIVTARDPIIDKLERFHRERGEASQSENNSPDKPQVPFPKTFWIYGDRDWMDVEAGKLTVDWINREKIGGEAKFAILKNAGHNLFLDNPEDFNAVIKQFLGWE